MAQQYYIKPSALGGGSRSFSGWTTPPDLVSTSNGTYTADIYADSVVLTGTGNEVATNNDSVRVKVTVYPKSFNTVVLN